MCNSWNYFFSFEQDFGTSKENSFTSEIVFYDTGLMLGLVNTLEFHINTPSLINVPPGQCGKNQ